jgi:hypothetical protein
MIVLIPITLCFAVGVLAVVLELRGRVPRTGETSRRYHAGLAFLLGALALFALSPQIALVFERPLPVDPPANPLAGEGCHDDSGNDAALIAFALALYFGARFGLGIIAAIARAIAQPPARVVTGKPAMTVAAIFLGVLFPIVSARILLPGPSADDFTTYGALTPDSGLRGWRIEHTIDALRAGPVVELPIMRGATSDITDGGGSHGYGGPYLKAGVHGWVGEQPVLIYESGGELVGAFVAERTVDRVPPDRRPRFTKWPLFAPLPGADGWLLVEHRPNRTIFAMKTYTDGSAENVDARDIWLILRPSEIPHGIAFALFLVGLACARTSLRRGNTPGYALLAAWLWLEAGAVDLFYYAPFLGL